MILHCAARRVRSSRTPDWRPPVARRAGLCGLGSRAEGPEIRVLYYKLWFMSYVTDVNPVLRGGCASARVFSPLFPRAAFTLKSES